MSNIDLSSWQKFKMYDLFYTECIGDTLQMPTGASVKKTDLVDGDTPRITVKGTDNGILGYYDVVKSNPNYRVYENFISVSFLGTVFYQEGKASLDMKVHCLKLKDCELNKYLGLFLVTSIKKSLKESRYSDQISSTVLPQIEIRLPTNKEGKPNFSYMESCMRHIEVSAKATLRDLCNIETITVAHINISKWKEFAISEIFPKIVKPVVYHTREVHQDFNGIPYIVRSKFNNGIKYRVTRPQGRVNPPNVISFGAENATFFYQKEEWISGRDIYFIDTRDIDEYACLFIVTCLQKIAAKYSYNYGLFPELLKKEKIKLPIDKEGNPDFMQMSGRMKALEVLSRHKIFVCSDLL